MLIDGLASLQSRKRGTLSLISLGGPGAMTMTAGISFRCIISAVPVVLLLDHCASCFTNLKKLKLDGVSVPGHLQCLLPECAVLEWLSIVRCTLHGLQTSQPLYRLRYLRVQHCEGMRKVEIQVPNFDVFKFHDSPMAIVLNGCLSLAEATVALLASSDCFNYAFTELPSGIPHARKLNMELIMCGNTKVCSMLMEI